MKEPSAEFKQAITSMGSLVVICEFCGITHYSSMEGDFEDGELELLEANHKENPDMYVDHLDEYARCGYLEGKQYVIDCTCNKARPYEDFIWKNRDMIVTYLKAKSEARLKEAQRNAELVGELSND